MMRNCIMGRRLLSSPSSQFLSLCLALFTLFQQSKGFVFSPKPSYPTQISDFHIVSQKANSALTKINAEQRPVQDVCSWLSEEHSVNMSLIEVKESPGRGYGIYAKQDIHAQTYVLKIPLEHCIYPEMVLKDEEVKEAAEEHLKYLSKQSGASWKIERALSQLLPAFLVKELAKEEKSSFYPYLSGLPWDSKRCVLNWNLDELCLLQGSSILQSVYYMRGETQIGIYMIEDILPESVKEHFGSDFERICKAAFFLANSRAACYTWDDEEKERLGIDKERKDTLVMAPLFDFLNHRRISPNCWFGGYDSEEESGMGVLTKRPIQKGEELTVSYGKKSNVNLFLIYDHVEEDDPLCWVARVPMTVHPEDPLYDLKMEILTRNGYVKDGRPDFSLVLKKRTPMLDLTDAQLAQLRIIAMSSEERLKAQGDKILKAWLNEDKKDETPKPEGNTLETSQTLSFDDDDFYDDDEDDDFKDSFYDMPRSEQRDVLYAISRLCSEMLSEFPSEFPEINFDVVDPEREAMARSFVETEKAVLNSYIINAYTKEDVFESLGV